MEASEVAHVFARPFITVVNANLPGSVFIRPAMGIAHDSRLRGAASIGDANHILNPVKKIGSNLASKGRPEPDGAVLPK